MEGRKLLAKGGNISIQVLLLDPVEFAEVNRKGIFVGIGKEVKSGKFLCLRSKVVLFTENFRCRLQCPPQ